MTRQASSVPYPSAPDGFSLLAEYDPETGLNHYRVKFTAVIEQTITDELLAMSGLKPEQIWMSAVNELTSNIKRSFQ